MHMEVNLKLIEEDIEFYERVIETLRQEILALESWTDVPHIGAEVDLLLQEMAKYEEVREELKKKLYVYHVAV